MPTYSSEVVNLLDSDDEGSVLAVWDGAAEQAHDDNSVVVLEGQRIEDTMDTMMEDNNSEATIERPAPFGYDNWRKFTDMHPGCPNGMGFLIFGSPQTWSRPFSCIDLPMEDSSATWLTPTGQRFRGLEIW